MQMGGIHKEATLSARRIPSMVMLVRILLRNNQGLRYGFAKFLKVKDVEKLRKALNSIQFWEIRLFANIAKYDRFVRKANIEGVGGGRVGVGGSLSKEKKVRRVACDVVVVGSRRKLELEKVKQEAILSEELRDRERVVEVSEGSGKKGEGEMEESLVREEEGRLVSFHEGAGSKVWSYLSLAEDVAWAKQSSTATLKHGFNLPFVQQSLWDAGLSEFKLIPLGGDKLLVRPRVDDQVVLIQQEVVDIINNFLEDVKPWTCDSALCYERGVWVRCFGIPMQAWNNIFFAELAETIGRLLKIDDATFNKDRMDYARFMIATPSLSGINSTAQVLIDNKLTSIRIIEDSDFEPLVEALVQNLHDDWGVNVHHEENPGCAENISKRAKVSPAAKPINSKGSNLSADDRSSKDKHKQWKQHSKGMSKYPYRRKVFPSVVGLKKIARLSEEDRA
ncbi:hypothetical protein TSUD_243380, partial [Trifolium subterraneum]